LSLFEDAPRLDLSHCLYISRYSGVVGQTGLRSLLQQARENNQRLGITGGLVFDGERFVQWLEGPGDAIDRLIVSLRHDDRHHDFVLLSEGPLAARRYRRWASGYAEPDSVDHFEQCVQADPSPETVWTGFRTLFSAADVE
jgi:Sensors of blue-light using FAD